MTLFHTLCPTRPHLLTYYFPSASTCISFSIRLYLHIIFLSVIQQHQHNPEEGLLKVQKFSTRIMMGLSLVKIYKKAWPGSVSVRLVLFKSLPIVANPFLTDENFTEHEISEMVPWSRCRWWWFDQLWRVRQDDGYVLHILFFSTTHSLRVTQSIRPPHLEFPTLTFIDLFIDPS